MKHWRLRLRQRFLAEAAREGDAKHQCQHVADSILAAPRLRRSVRESHLGLLPTTSLGLPATDKKPRPHADSSFRACNVPLQHRRLIIALTAVGCSGLGCSWLAGPLFKPQKTSGIVTKDVGFLVGAEKRSAQDGIDT